MSEEEWLDAAQDQEWEITTDQIARKIQSMHVSPHFPTTVSPVHHETSLYTDESLSADTDHLIDIQQAAKEGLYIDDGHNDTTAKPAPDTLQEKVLEKDHAYLHTELPSQSHGSTDEANTVRMQVDNTVVVDTGSSTPAAAFSAQHEAPPPMMREWQMAQNANQ
jgi:hypothetical protein